MKSLRQPADSPRGDPSRPARAAEPKQARTAGRVDEAGAAFDLGAAVGWLEHDQRSRLVVDHDLKVLWANAAARRNLRRPMPVYLDAGHLRFDNDVDPAECRDFVLGADATVKRRALVSGQGEGCSVLNVWSNETGPSRSIFVRVAVSQPQLDLHETGLVAEFGLTRAEGNVAQRLALLETPARIADELGLSVHTVRTHIRRIYAKLSIHSQTQFMRLAHTFAWA